MTQFMQQHTGQKDDRKDGDGKPLAATQDQKHGLDLAMQKPLEKYQRQESQYKPKQACELYKHRKLDHGSWRMDHERLTIIHEPSLFARCFRDRDELIHLQARAADQCSINFGLVKKFRRIGSGH